MDWSRTKSIFIIVFSILNIFLYTLYVERYTEAENFSVLSEPPVDDRLEGDKITYPADLESEPGEEPYISGTRKAFTKEEVLVSDTRAAVMEEYMLNVAFNKPIRLGVEKNKDSLEAFLESTVYKGGEYALWDVNEEERQATFFQEIDDKTLYHSDSGKVTLYWNEQGEAIRYEQTIFTDLEENKQTKELIAPKRAIETLYQKRMLQQNSEVTSVTLGYSVYVAVSDETRILLPTWRIVVENEDGTTADYFVNAVKDGVIEFNQTEEEEGLE